MIFYWDDVFDGYRSRRCVIVIDSYETAMEVGKETFHSRMHDELRKTLSRHETVPFIIYRHGCD